MSHLIETRITNSRATTCWSQGFNAAGVTSDIAMFAGNIKYRKSIYDTTGENLKSVISFVSQVEFEICHILCLSSRIRNLSYPLSPK